MPNWRKIIHESSDGTISQDTTGNSATVTNGVYTTGSQSIAGEKTFTNNLKTNDNVALNMGTGEDLVLYHNATDSFIEGRTGNLYVQGLIHLGVQSGDTVAIGKTGVTSTVLGALTVDEALTVTGGISNAGTISNGVWSGSTLIADKVPNHDDLNGFVANEHIDWTASSAGTIHATNYTNTTYSEATGSGAGLMSIAHHDKLDGIEASATADELNLI